MATPPSPRTFGELRKSGYKPRRVRDELRGNLQDRIRRGTPLFEGIHGFEDTVVPAVQNALLCGHDMIFLGERGQAKTRMIRSLTSLLDEWIPIVTGSELRDDPFAPASPDARAKLAECGDETGITWLHRDDRYVEKLATPDTSVGDLIGDVDPIKVAQGRSLSDVETMHFGLVPRSNRGLFCINELPDLTEKVQVAMFNVMQERDVQVKGYTIRLPIDVVVIASANPEDYTSRGRIITPLKDRYAAQIRTHYARTRDLELEIVRQEALVPQVEGIAIFLPEFMEKIVGELTFQARHSPDVNQASGVSVRMSIANYETLIANALRRALRLGESDAVPRVSDLDALATSSSGKLELEYAGAERSESEVIAELMQKAVRIVFDELIPLEGMASVIESFNDGWKVETSAEMPAAEYLAGLDEIGGLKDAAARLAGGDSPARIASAIEFILEGLHLSNRLNKSSGEAGARYQKA